jgi:hypothetical protein
VRRNGRHIGWWLRTATRAGHVHIARTTLPLPLPDFRFHFHQQTPGVRWGKGNNMNIELHEHLMRVTVGTFKKETDKLKAEIARREECRVKESAEWFAMRAAMMVNGFTQTPAGEWMPPLGKRPDFEGADLIKAALASIDAQRQLTDAAQRYADSPK